MKGTPVEPTVEDAIENIKQSYLLAVAARDRLGNGTIGLIKTLPFLGDEQIAFIERLGMIYHEFEDTVEAIPDMQWMYDEWMKEWCRD